MSIKIINLKTLSQLCLAILFSTSLIACSDEGSSNSSDDNGTRTVTTPSGTEITIESDGDDRTIRTPGNNTFNLNCSDNDTFVFEGSEIDVCS